MNDLSHMTLHTRSIQRAQEMKFGATLTATGVRFRLWAPDSDTVAIRVEGQDGDLPMGRMPRGWFELEVDGIGAGTRYSFVLPDGTCVPDPASRYQPEDVSGPSEVIDPRAFPWSDAGWRSRPWEESVFYELHVGTFTEQGTFLATIEKLDYLKDLGITAIEFMPIADFKGRWNWGYDGALLFAPDSSYGRPEDLKALIDAAHVRGLMVVLDVVYNHFGPSGNYMNIYAPQLTDAHRTPWGPAVNVDDDGSAMIRDFIISNARYWLNEYNFDGLRFDAVSEIHDSGPKHLLQELAEQLRASTDGRHLQLVLENSDNQVGWLRREEDQRRALYTAQWSDDIHHTLHSAATGEGFTYYADFVGRIDLLARALAEGCAYQGELLQHQRIPRGEPSAQLPATAFVSFIQNHDHVGNRPFGERLHHIAARQAVRSLAAINLLSPHIPLLFMGEEWAAPQPFLYFSDMGEELADKIRDGQIEQNKEFPSRNRPSPDPMAEGTFRACKLQWDDLESSAGTAWRELYKKLLKLRRTEITPRLPGMEGHSGHYEIVAGRAVRISWKLGDGSTLLLFANLSPEPIDGVNVSTKGRHLWLEGIASGHTLEPWGVVFSLEDEGMAA